MKPLRHQAIPLLYSTLSYKEKQVLQQIYHGQSTGAVARRHHVSVSTIAAQRSMILRKMAVDSTVELVFWMKTAKLHSLVRIIYQLCSRTDWPLAEVGNDWFLGFLELRQN